MNAITVEDARKVYRGTASEPVHAVDGVSFDVSQGQIYGLLGPNGAGKTTLVKILTTLTSPSSGRATIYGFDVVRQGPFIHPRELLRTISGIACSRPTACSSSSTSTPQNATTTRIVSYRASSRCCGAREAVERRA